MSILFIKKSIIFIFLVAFTIPFASFQEAKFERSIIEYFENRDAKKLAQYFNQNVELALPGNKNIYSKAQAQQVIAKFFSNNNPESFKLHSNTIERDTQNIIGLLATKNGSFRVYIVIKKTNDNNVIHIIKIENRTDQNTPSN